MTSELNDLLSLAATLEANLPPPVALPVPVGNALAGWIDHTLLKQEATPAQVEQLCNEAVEYHFAAVCVNPVFVPLVANRLAGSGVATCSVVGFPLGAVPAAVKAMETRWCVEAGATEIDMVIPVGLMKAGEPGQVFEHVRAVVEAASGAKVKVILETVYLNRLEKITACLLCKKAGASFVKTSTGFASAGATVEDVALMRAVVGEVKEMGVKAAGGVRSLADAQAMIQAGANRIGTSGGVKIIQQALASVGKEETR